MASEGPVMEDTAFIERALQVAIRIALVLLLVGWCFAIVRPFVVPAIWGMIIAVATYSAFDWLQGMLGGQRLAAGAIYVLLGLVLLIVPALVLSFQVIESAPRIASALSTGEIAVPPPPARVESWPIIGGQLYRFWELASTNLQEALRGHGSELKAIGGWFLGLAGSIGIAVIQFVIAIIIAAAFLVTASGGARVADAISLRLVGERGPTYATLARATIRSVARGIVGIALIQSILAGLGFVAIGLPAAGMLSILCLILAIIQVGPGLVIVPVIIYQFSVGDTTPAVLFAIWGVFVTLLDNILKPVLLGRGVQVPMLVIFIGAIGGLLSSGILGLFVGPVVLGLGYTIFTAWVREVSGRIEGQA